MLYSLDWEKVTYILFIIAAIITRFYDVGSRVMSHDESLHTQFSYQFFNGDGFAHTPLMHGPFLFHITAVSYWLFGATDAAARYPNALFGVLLVAMPYLLRGWLGKRGALFTSFLFLISPYVTYYSRYIRHDVYVIVWAMIVFIAIAYYTREQKDKYLYWFAGGLAMMFATKEVAFIYVAIFGLIVGIRLLAKIGASEWIRPVLPDLRVPIMVTMLGLLLMAAGFAAHLLVDSTEIAQTAVEDGDVSLAEIDTLAMEAVADDGEPVGMDIAFRWIQIVGLIVFSAGLFLAIRAMRPQLDDIPEFDIVMLFTTLVLPMMAPVFVTLRGWNPTDYSFNTCTLVGQETMSAVQVLTGKLGSAACWSDILNSGVMRTGYFLAGLLLVSVLVGLWWNKRRWLIAAVIFHSLFFVFYTSVFTNAGGWTSGMVGSLGYWMEQQEVQRGSQPWFYYLFVMPFYEYLVVLFSLLATWVWAKKNQVHSIVGYWFGVLVTAVFAYSLANWKYNQPSPDGLPPLETTIVPGLMLAVFILLVSIVFWYTVRHRQIRERYEVKRPSSLFRIEMLYDFFPVLFLWTLMTWAAYSYAGEKMPWLSFHFVIPMAMMTGYYFEEQLRGVSARDLLAKPALMLFGVMMLLVTAVFLAIAPLFLGKINFDSQTVSYLNNAGRFFGSVLVAAVMLYSWRHIRGRANPAVRRPIILLTIFALLSILTIRASYMAAFPNADSSSEYLVYAHGAPATKSVVLDQLDELSMRLEGDKSLNVAFDNDSSWPFTWYLRDYTNRVYFGETPGNTLTESPLIIVGNSNWGKVEPFLGDDYQATTHTFLWWPMEDYRNISWNAILGDPTAADDVRRGLGNADVRQALWDIFFYRDYTKYGEVFGGTYTAGEWPLRHELKMYIRKDTLATLWDYGTGATAVVPPVDPYAEGELTPQLSMVINESGFMGADDGQLTLPRNVAIGENGRLYVADSGNNRIQVFDANGEFSHSWGTSGSAISEFSEPWSVAVDEEFVYVADTWNHRIQKFTLDGEFVAILGVGGAAAPDDTGGGLGLFFGPRDIELLPDNQLLVSDTGNHRLQIISRDGEPTAQVGGWGVLLGQFNEPVGLATSPVDGSVFVADTWNGRLQQFTPDLFALNEWPVDAWSSESIDNKPYTAIDSAGNVYVTDPEGYRVLIFDAVGNYLGRFGYFDTGTGGFGLPNGIAIDADDYVYIADAANNRILKFEPVFAGIAPVLEPDVVPLQEENGEEE